MKHYLLSVIQPAVEPPADLDLARIERDVAVYVDELKEAGAWVFSDGLCAPSTATVLRVENDDVLTTDGPYAEAKEFLGGLTIIRAEDLDAALAWGRKAARATTLPIEVRPFQTEAV
jgi:hypothetical protein